MTKFSLWTERVSVSLPGSMPKFPARSLALFLPERYSAPRRARHCIVLSAFPRAQVCLSSGAQLPLSVPGRYAKVCLTEGIRRWLALLASGKRRCGVYERRCLAYGTERFGERARILGAMGPLGEQETSARPSGGRRARGTAWRGYAGLCPDPLKDLRSFRISQLPPAGSRGDGVGVGATWPGPRSRGSGRRDVRGR